MWLLKHPEKCFWSSKARTNVGMYLASMASDRKEINGLTIGEAEYEYERQGPAPRSGLAPPVLIFQTSPSCNFFIQISRF